MAEMKGEMKSIGHWVNEFSVMLIHTPYNNALYDAQALRDELEEDLKNLGYMDTAHHVKFNMESFIPGDKTGVTVFDEAIAPIDWEIKIAVPTFEMEKREALKMAEISKFQIERICKRRKHFLFRAVHSQLGYVKFNQCRKMLEEEEDKFEEIDI
jgi:hypothetical protein